MSGKLILKHFVGSLDRYFPYLSFNVYFTTMHLVTLPIRNVEDFKAIKKNSRRNLRQSC